MQIVIDIDEDFYKNCNYFKDIDNVVLTALETKIANGTPLPKGHGRLGDLDELKQTLENHHNFFVMAYGNINKANQCDKSRLDEIDNCIAEIVNAPTIIEADRGE